MKELIILINRYIDLIHILFKENLCTRNGLEMDITISDYQLLHYDGTVAQLSDPGFNSIWLNIIWLC